MLGVILVDHGSKLAASNELLEETARQFAGRYGQQFPIVEPAHMELAEPSIATAYARCAARGADRIIVLPFFLGPGRHWTSDIPRLAAAAATQHPHTRHAVAPPLGVDDLILELLARRAAECLDGGF